MLEMEKFDRYSAGELTSCIQRQTGRIAKLQATDPTIAISFPNHPIVPVATTLADAKYCFDLVRLSMSLRSKPDDVQLQTQILQLARPVSHSQCAQPTDEMISLFLGQLFCAALQARNDLDLDDAWSDRLWQMLELLRAGFTTSANPFLQNLARAGDRGDMGDVVGAAIDASEFPFAECFQPIS